MSGSGRKSRQKAAGKSPKPAAAGPAPRTVIAAVLGIAVIGAALLVFTQRAPSPADAQATATTIPLDAAGQRGALQFAENCAACHGEAGVGSDSGPPLVHRIYEPSHHGDISFLYAVRRGVRQHHWRFGNMPPQPQIDDGELADIVAYVRALQRANGIH